MGVLVKKFAFMWCLLLCFVSPALAMNKNDIAPTFSLRDSNNKNFFLSDYVGPKKKPGTKGLILSFFASYCEPCKRELPILNSLVEEFEKKGIKIVIVGFKEDFDKISGMLEEVKVDKPIVLSDTYGKVGQKYGVTGLPRMFFIGADGRVKDVLINADNLEKVIREKAGKLVR